MTTIPRLPTQRLAGCLAGCLAGLWLTLTGFPLEPAPTAPQNPPAAAEAAHVRTVAYLAQLSPDAARVDMTLVIECPAKAGGRVTVAEGEVAIEPARLPQGVTLHRDGARFDLHFARPGTWRLTLPLVLRVQRAEGGSEARFWGPLAGIATVEARVDDGTEVELLKGMALAGGATGGCLKGVLGAERELALRWRNRATSGARRDVATCESLVTARATPGVLQVTTELRYQVLQGSLPSLRVLLPEGQSLTRVEGESIRDWKVTRDGGADVLEVDLLKPAVANYTLKLFTERAVESLPHQGELTPPEPRGVDRESGLLSVQANDVTLDTTPLAGLRQVNAVGDAHVSYRFHGRPAALNLALTALEPVIGVSNRIQLRLEDHRILTEHTLSVTVDKAGVYALEFGPLSGTPVTEVRSEGLESWKVREDRLSLTYTNRLLGERTVVVQLEQPHRSFPDQVTVQPLPLLGASRQSSQVSVTAAPGIQAKTSAMNALREVPVQSLDPSGAAALAYVSLQPDWSLELATERLAPRIVADTFNLVAVGDGIVGGSATLRYAILNQGVQEFRLQVPPSWRNVDFTGPSIRRKDRDGDIWSIGLQDKAWGAYTLVITYDQPVEAGTSRIQVGGLRVLDAERDTGSMAITSVAGFELREADVPEGLQRIDEAELSDADRALLTRPALLAYRHAGHDGAMVTLETRRFAAASVLAAVADRTQMTTVVTEDGQMLTQAGFMVKNQDKQFQSVQLPKGAELWSAFVNGGPVKAEKQGNTILVPLPRVADRDQVIAVELVYAQQAGSLRGWQPRRLALTAPVTDVQTTYAEWEVFAPLPSQLGGFEGSMQVARGTTYGWTDAWLEFHRTWRDLLTENVGLLVLFAFFAALAALAIVAIRRGAQGVVTLVVALGIVVILGGMLLPALSKAKAKATRISAINSLKQIGLAARIYGTDNQDQLPASFEDMKNELSTDKVTVDPSTGRRFIYLGGMLPSKPAPDLVLAYSPEPTGGGRPVLLVDGSTHQMSESRFNEELQRTLAAAGHLAQAAPPASSPAAQAASPTLALAPGALPMAVGLRPIRIDLPRTGQRLVFTQVLNVRREPLSVRAWVVRRTLWTSLRGLAQAAVFSAGLLLLVRAWRNPRASSLRLATAAALVLGSLADMLIVTRLLGIALTVVVPILVLAALIALFRRRRAQPVEASEPPELPATPSAAFPSILLGLFLAAGMAQGAEPARPTAEGAPPRILEARYRSTITGTVARLEAVFRVTSTTPDSVVPLLGNDAALESFSAGKSGARLVRSRDGVAVQLPRRGEAEVTLQAVLKAEGDASRRRLSFGIPPALVSRMTVVINEPGATVVFPAAIACATRTEGNQTFVDATLGAATTAALEWTPRVKLAADESATVFCETFARVTVGAGAVNCLARLDLNITQGELRSLPVDLPAGHRVLRVEGNGVRTWTIQPAGASGSTLHIQFTDPLTGTHRLQVETEQPWSSLPSRLAIEVPRAQSIRRETGWIAIGGGEDQGLVIEEQQGLQKADAAEFARLGPGAGPVAAAFQFLRPGYRLAVRAEALQPQIQVNARHAFRIGLDEQWLESVLRYNIQRAGVFSLACRVPPGLRVTAVEPVDAELPRPASITWSERGSGTNRVLDVRFPVRTQGAVQLRVVCTQTTPALPPTVDVPQVQPLDASLVDAQVVVTADPGVQLKPDLAEGLSEVPANSVPGGGSGFAFKVLDREKPDRWHLRLATGQVEPWVRAEIVNLLTLGDGIIAGRAIVRFDVQNAPVREFRLRMPDGARNVEVLTAQLRRRDHDGAEWRIELQNRVSGVVQMQVTWEQPWTLALSGQDIPVAVAGVSAPGVERETGYVAVGSRQQLELSAATLPEGVLRADTQELPDWADRPETGLALAFRYLGAGPTLALTARRHDPAAMLQALVDEAQLTSVVADDGQMMTELNFAVRNNGRQFIALTLPAGAEVWSTFVNGQPVRPVLREGSLLLPLERPTGGAAVVPVQVTYVGAVKFPRRNGRVQLDSPAVDLPVKNARWELYLPMDFDYDTFGGTMGYDAAAARVIGAFSAVEYSQAESSRRREERQQVSNSILAVRSSLAKGDLEEANKSYVMAQRYGLKKGQAEVDQLDRELRAAQSGNLRRAQEHLLANNGLTVFQNQQTISGYDEQVAAQQWARVQQAQEVAPAAARPLRVNLPTRGLRHAFSQALQMDIGKPLRVEFTAANLRAPNWFLRATVFAAVFAALWGACTLLLRQRGAIHRG